MSRFCAFCSRLWSTSILVLMRLTLESRARGGTRDRVYGALREAIVSARLEPGRKLSEVELTHELGVSRTPIREALALLREDRLVAIVPQLGTFVTLISADAVADAAFVREALECSAVRRTAERIEAAGLEDLSANLVAQERAERSGDTEAFDGLDDGLHRLICEHSGHRIAWELSRRANGQLDRVRRLSLPEPGYVGQMVAEHREVVAAIADRDADRAEAALRHHLRMVLSQVPALEREHPEFFEDARP